MKFFSFISNSYACQNKLQKEIAAYLVTQNRKITDQQDIQDFRDQIQVDITVMSAQNPRCKEIKADWWNAHGSNDWHLSLGGAICTFNLYASN